MKVGDRVKVRSGSMAGAEGLVVETERRFVYVEIPGTGPAWPMHREHLEVIGS